MMEVVKLEKLDMVVISVYAMCFFHQAWWAYLLLLFGPDISVLGYWAGNRSGAFSYNLFHHKGVAVLLLFAGILFFNQIIVIAGIILFGHSSLDIVFGYGLKYQEGFVFTHLGAIGNQKIK